MTMMPGARQRADMNFYVFYEMDEQQAEHAFSLNKYHKTVVLTRSGKPGVNFFKKMLMLCLE